MMRHESGDHLRDRHWLIEIHDFDAHELIDAGHIYRIACSVCQPWRQLQTPYPEWRKAMIARPFQDLDLESAITRAEADDLGDIATTRCLREIRVDANDIVDAEDLPQSSCEELFTHPVRGRRSFVHVADVGILGDLRLELPMVVAGPRPHGMRCVFMARSFITATDHSPRAHRGQVAVRTMTMSRSRVRLRCSVHWKTTVYDWLRA